MMMIMMVIVVAIAIETVVIWCFRRFQVHIR